MSDASCKITILTPTYNRADKLPRLFDSLSQQTVKGFQWLVIDDGSTDGTKDYVLGLDPSGFSVEYRYKTNGGKHTALNFSHPYIKGEYVCIVDSDDYLVPDAVESMLSIISRFETDPQIVCYSFQKGFNTGEPLVKNIPDDPVVSDHIEYRLNGNRPGDCCEVEKTTVFLEFPFPEFPGEKFMSEGYLWFNIGLKYKTVYINKVIYICEYLEGGLTSSGRKLRIKSPLGGRETANLYMSAPKLKPKLLLKQMMLYICFGKTAGFKVSSLYDKCCRKGLFVLCYPAGWIMYKVWSRKYR